MRSTFAFLTVLCACAPAAASGPTPEAPPRPAPPTVASAPAVPPSSATMVQRSHDILAAMDRADVDAVAAVLSPDYVHFEGDYVDCDHELASLRARRGPGAPHIATRTWSHEHGSVGENDAVVIGEALEHTAGNESHGGYNYDGWYSFTWSRQGDAWKLVYLGWRQGGPSGKRGIWNEIFRNSIGFNHEPNRLLVETVAHVRPGAALDVAMGQGRNALYLAAHGWKVTGVDISDEGLAAARAEAAKRKLTLEAIDTDIDRYDFGVGKWDLVTMIYATDNASWMEKIKTSLRKGGVFVLEYFALDPSSGQDDGIAPGKREKIFAE